MHYMIDPIDAFFQNKGKGNKGKSKFSHMSEQEIFWNFKGQSPYHSKDGKGFGKNPVNAYALYGMELASTTKASTGASSSSLASQAYGMLDCGATASAAPEVSAQELVKAVLSHDRQATVNILSAQRPNFRFGNGKWGRARYKLDICSDVSGQKKTFSLYALPNPIEFYQPNFDKSQLVPILIGMDHLGAHGCQMLVGFGSGLAMDGVDDNPEVYQLPVNPKKHYMWPN